MFKKLLGFLLLTLVNFYDSRAIAATGTCFSNIVPTPQWGNLGTSMDSVCQAWCSASSCAYASLVGSDGCEGNIYCSCNSCTTTGGGTGGGTTGGGTTTGTSCYSSATLGTYGFFYAGYTSGSACVPVSGVFQCLSGFYGKSTSSFFNLQAYTAAYNYFSGGCQACPSYDDANIMTGGTYAYITDCIATGGTHTDAKGTFTPSGNCYYSS